MTVSVIRDLRDLAQYHFDPVQDVTRFIRDCRNSGMNKTEIIEEVEDQLQYGPSEAKLIVNEFWDKTA